MTQVSQLDQTEQTELDEDRVIALSVQLGAQGAEDLIKRAMEELALRLTQAEKQLSQGDSEAMQKGLRSMGAIADQIGMTKLTLVAADVNRTINQNDNVALAATFSRLMRVGEQSLMAMWHWHDPPL